MTTTRKDPLDQPAATDQPIDLIDVLKAAYEADASDVHLIAGQPPVIRVHQVMTPMDFPVISKEQARKFVEQMAPPSALAAFEKNMDADFSFQVECLARYRVNAHMQRGQAGMALRMIKTKDQPLTSLNLPETIALLSYLPRG